MLKARVAVIGGTGIGEGLIAMGGRVVTVPTPYGAIRGRVIEFEGQLLFALQRHSAGHKTPPHKVRYKALATGLKAIGVTHCFSSAAVGSLNTDWGPGTLAVCTDMLDLTGRRLTLFDSQVRHTDMSEPFPGSSILVKGAENLGVEVRPAATYVGLDGPRYESPAEIRMLQTLGGDVVGMTASTEAVLMREAGVTYGCLAVVTNLGCGLSAGTLDHGEVTNVMGQYGSTVLKLLLEAARSALS